MTLPLARMLGCAAGILVIAAGCQTLKLDRQDVAQWPDTAPVPPLELAWTYNAGAGFGPDAPHLTNDMVLVGTRRGEAHAVSLVDGRRLGIRRFGEVIEGGLQVLGDDVVVPVAWGRRSLVSYDLRKGKVNWDQRGTRIRAGLLALDSGFVAVDVDGRVDRLDSHGGLRWTAALEYAARTRPLLYGDQIVVADERGQVTSFAMEDGSTLWQVQAGGPVYTSPALFGDHVVVPTTRGGVVFLEARTGSVAATYQEPDTTVRFSEPGTGHGMVAVGGSDGSLVAFAHPDAEPLWKHDGTEAFVSAPLVTQDHVFAASMGSMLYAFAKSDGRQVWHTELRGRSKSGLAAHGDKLVVLTEPRIIQAFKSENAESGP